MQYGILASMSRGDWFRNSEWSPDRAAVFYAKLSKARSSNKAQYLRIQACHLSRTHPRTALELLDQYFSLGDHFDDAPAYLDQAHAFLALGLESDALRSLELALAREAEFPGMRTEAALEFALLVSTRRYRDKYEASRVLLTDRSRRWIFPLQLFKLESSLALMNADLGFEEAARNHASRALALAEAKQSGLSHHAGLGLVGSDYPDLRAELAALLCAGETP